ncbi:MAG TPA: glycosyltransferase family 2 protein [Thermoanaerobaculia bacterium]|jgi:cellulose synthase/poly-beta-1,6-N-acetylglucosamine synthase-like glycosyltransferase
MKRTIVSVALLLGLVLFLLDRAARNAPAVPATGFELAVYLLVSVVVFLDLIDIVVRLTMARRTASNVPTSMPLDVGEFTPRQMKLHLEPWALIVSVHNLEDDLDPFLEAMEPYREHLWVIDDASTDRTFLRLQQAGIHCFRGSVNRKKPGALKELMHYLPPEITTVGILDPDVHIRNSSRSEISDLEQALFFFQRSGCAAMCPRIAVRQDGWLARLQGLEYAVTFAVGRKSLADRSITSGVAFYRRDALEHVFERHKLSVYAEDLRNALLLLGHGEQIYYDERLVVDTIGKRTLHSWFSQRVGWFFGLIRVYQDSFGDIRRIAGNRPFFVYHYVFYMGICALALHPLKLVALALSISGVANAFDDLLGLGVIPNTAWTDPAYFVLAYLKYTLLTAFLLTFVVKGDRKHLVSSVPLFYLYELLHIVPVTIGYANWLTLRYFGRRIFRDHFQDEESLAREFREQFRRAPVT